MTEEIKFRVDLITKGELMQIAEDERRDLSDIMRFAAKDLITNRKRRQKQPELELYAIG